MAITAIMIWGAYCGVSDVFDYVAAIGSMILAAGFVWENRRLLPRAGDGNIIVTVPHAGRYDRLARSLGPAATALFLALTALSAEMGPYLLMRWFQPS